MHELRFFYTSSTGWMVSVYHFPLVMHILQSLSDSRECEVREMIEKLKEILHASHQKLI